MLSRFVFLSDPSVEAKAQGRGPKGWHSTLVHFQLSVLSNGDHLGKQHTIRFNDHLFTNPTLNLSFFERLPNVLSLSFVIWNFNLGKSDSPMSFAKSLISLFS